MKVAVIVVGSLTISAVGLKIAYESKKSEYEMMAILSETEPDSDKSGPQQKDTKSEENCGKKAELSETKDGVILVPCHREMHKLSETGMDFTKQYRVFSKYNSTGTWLTEPGGGSYEKIIKVRDDFITDTKKKRDLYELRDKTGCFTLRLPVGVDYLEITDFHTGKCEFSH